MTTALLAVAPLLATLVAGPPAFDYASYTPVDLADFMERALTEHPDLLVPFKGRNRTLFHPVEKIRFQAVFAGQSRPLAAFKRDVIDRWTKINAPPLAGAFQREILVRDGPREHWVALQESLWPFLQREVKAGECAVLFVVFIGSVNEDWLLLVNEFGSISGGSVNSAESGGASGNTGLR